MKILVAFLTLLTACDGSKIPGWWKTYRHPTLSFEVRVPRSWKVQQDSTTGAAVIFVLDDEGHVFRPSINIFAKLSEGDSDLEKLSELSVKQLTYVLRGYRLLAQATTTLGGVPGMELRGEYEGSEGKRLIRSLIAKRERILYIMTFSCTKEDAAGIEETFNQIRRSFEFVATTG